ncbi:hypothetical protein BC831DRAFT_484008 [Entophlyctis helioformis]|nr:hypothetical protein BC831DRAFT_484008 [Entophlyctis helioformis]
MPVRKYIIVLWCAAVPCMQMHWHSHSPAAAHMIRTTKNINQSTPIVGLTAEEPTFAQTQTFDDIMAKPVTKDALHRTLAAIAPADSLLAADVAATVSAMRG